jgi:hypothetical protein
MKKVIANPNIGELVKELSASFKNKKSMKSLKWMAKRIDMSYLFAYPALASIAIQDLEIVNAETTEINILIHSTIKQDCIDHFRWFALLPYLLGYPELRINVVSVTKSESCDTQTNFRRVIDVIINKELDGNFSSELVVGELYAVLDSYGDDYFDVVFNNIPLISDYNSKEDIYALRGLVSNSTPLVISDFSHVTLLHRYNALRLVGFESTTDVRRNKNAMHLPNCLSATYEHFGHYIVIDSLVEFETTSLELLSQYDSLGRGLVIRLEHGDPMIKEPSKNNGIITFCTDVEYDTSSKVATLNYLGDNYKIPIDDLGENSFDFCASDLNSRSLNVYWGFNSFIKIVNEIQILKGAAA